MPDIPEHAPNRSSTETYAVFLSDLHVGSMYFMEKELNDFISWLSSPDPIARKVRFVLICGDVVDGVGIYPNQDKELALIDVKEQLEKTVEILEKIPKHIRYSLFLETMIQEGGLCLNLQYQKNTKKSYGAKKIFS
jgi:DNA polymerase II small subunit